MIEYIDILDEKGDQTGQVLSKKEMHEKSLWHRTVNLWIITSEHKILLAQRSKNKVFPLHWAHAVAGHVSAGETSIEAVLKESREELHLNLNPEDLELLFTYPKVEEFPGKAVTHRSIFDIFLLEKDIDPKDIEINPEEVARIKLVSFSDLEKMIAAPGVMLPFPQEYPKILEILKDRFQE